MSDWKIVQRESRTERYVRSLDMHEIVTWLHRLEDELEAAQDTIAERDDEITRAESGEREALSCLQELFALVMGECPSLLDEDSGGSADLCLRIEETLRSPAPTWRGATEPCEACGAPAGVVCPEVSDRCRAICSCPTCSFAPTVEGGESDE